jgi:four helix bundle protein
LDSHDLRFIRIARGSLSELETLLIIAHNLHFVGEEHFESLSGKCESIGATMDGLCRSLRKATVRDEEGSYEKG